MHGDLTMRSQCNCGIAGVFDTYGSLTIRWHVGSAAGRLHVLLVLVGVHLEEKQLHPISQIVPVKPSFAYFQKIQQS